MSPDTWYIFVLWHKFKYSFTARIWNVLRNAPLGVFINHVITLTPAYDENRFMRRQWNGGIAPHILDRDTRRRLAVSTMLYSPMEPPDRFALDSRRCVLQVSSWKHLEWKKTSCCRKPATDCRACTLVTAMTELHRLFRTLNMWIYIF